MSRPIALTLWQRKLYLTGGQSGDKAVVETITQNLVNKIRPRSDDQHTIEAAQRATEGSSFAVRKPYGVARIPTIPDVWAQRRQNSNLSSPLITRRWRIYHPYDLFRQGLRVTRSRLLYQGSGSGGGGSGVEVSVWARRYARGHF